MVKKAKKITEEATLDVVLKIPGAEKILAKYNLPCLWCPLARFEIQDLTLGQVCEIYKIDLEKLLQELNKMEK